MNADIFLLPVLALVVWSLVIWTWMYATRIPAMIKHRVPAQDAQSPRGAWRARLPDNVNWVSDNFANLHEQPTAFYALMVVMFLMGLTSGGALWLGWIYVVLRVLHSLSQIIGNRVMVRFVLFLLSALVLVALAGVAVCGVVFG